MANFVIRKTTQERKPITATTIISKHDIYDLKQGQRRETQARSPTAKSNRVVKVVSYILHGTTDIVKLQQQPRI